MTIERKIVIGLEDIRAVSFECVKCHAKVSVPPDNIGDVPSRCEHCRQPWNVMNLQQFETFTSPFVGFVNCIGKIRLLGHEHSGFKILLEFEEPK